MSKLTRVELFQSTSLIKGDNSYDRILPVEELHRLLDIFMANPSIHNRYIPKIYTSSTADELFQVVQSSGTEAHEVIERTETNDMLIRRALVLSEPKDMRHSSSLGKTIDSLVDTAADLTVKTIAYVQEHTNSFWSMSPEDLYTTLTKIVFGTLDTDAITQKYPLKIRRGFRLAIVNFIDTIAIIKAHRDELRNNTRRMSERDAIDMQMSKILATNFTHGKDVSIEFLPYAIIIYLDKHFYEQFDRRTRGVTISGYIDDPRSEFLFDRRLSGRVILINTANKKDVDLILNHELRHVIYACYFRFLDSIYSRDTKSNSFQSSKHREYFRKLRKFIFEHSREEMIAYLPLNPIRLFTSHHAFDGSLWNDHEDMVKSATRGIFNKNKIKNLKKEFKSARKQYDKDFKKYSSIAKKLYKIAQQNENGLTIEKVEALLFHSPVEIVDRLSRYYANDNLKGYASFSARIYEIVRRIR